MMRLTILEKIRGWLHPLGITKRKVGLSTIWFHPKFDQVIRDYYEYVLQLLLNTAGGCTTTRVIVLGHFTQVPEHAVKALQIDFQIEHTLVKPGGRGSEGSPVGAIPIPGEPPGRYLVRIQDARRLDLADVILEYSRPNLINVQSSGLFDSLAGRMHYIAPLVYPTDISRSSIGRSLDIITLFGNPEEPRRKALLQALKKKNPDSQNIRGHFSDIRSIYESTKILVNVRQTEHHDTLEELRVLPALLCGAIVVSEDVPLREQVPYHRFVLWAPMEDIPAMVQKVRADYASYFHDIFQTGEFDACVKDMQTANEVEVRRFLQIH
jgi:hypothetical protein